MKLGGWHRLWIVFSVFYFVLIIVCTIDDYPKSENITYNPKFYQALSSDSKNKIIEIDYIEQTERPANIRLVTMPNKQVIAFDAKYSKKDLGKACSEYWSIIEKELRIKKLNFLWDISLFWLIPCFALYALGFSITWVIAGFKR